LNKPGWLLPSLTGLDVSQSGRGSSQIADTLSSHHRLWFVPKVRRRRVPKRQPSFVEADEVPRVLAELPATWRPFFATAVDTGLRKGELIGLRKKDVDLKRRLLTVERSYNGTRRRAATQT
jgi:integrase